MLSSRFLDKLSEQTIQHALAKPFQLVGMISGIPLVQDEFVKFYLVLKPAGRFSVLTGD